jgi:membrane associated rhomboid family serine protease
VSLHNRDYMQADKSPAAGRWLGLGASHWIIVLNVIVFLLWQMTPGPFMEENFLVGWSGLFEHGRIWTVVTAAFSHQGLYHLGWNMIFLHWFGTELEQIYGRRNFTLLYLHGAVVASLAHVAWAHRQGSDVPMLGASGAVMAVVVVTAIFYPSKPIYIYFFSAPLWLLASFKLLGDFAGMFNHASGTSHAAHLGGAAAGVFFWWFDLRLFASPGQEYHERPWPGLGAWLGRLRLSRRAPARDGPRVDGDTALQVDELLRKISREGMASLTPEEVAFLKGTSERYKDG